jgi:urease accessory protein UreF
LLKNSLPLIQDDNESTQATSQGLNKSNLLLYQLSDASCPTGAFAHSYTIEVASQLKIITPKDGSFKAVICQHIWDVLLQTFTTSVPFLKASCQLFDQHRISISTFTSNNNSASFVIVAEKWDQIDLEQSISISSHVASRASSLQGSGMFRAFSNAFPQISLMIKELKRRVSEGSKHEQIYRGHSATCFGAVAGMLGIDAATATSIFLYTTSRDMVNAAVRMNLIGPLEGGNVTYILGGMIEMLIATHLQHVGRSRITLFQEPNIFTYQPCPLLDILSNAHDRLYTRLFNS